MKTHSEERRDGYLLSAASAAMPEAGLGECMELVDLWRSAPALLRQRDALLAALHNEMGYWNFEAQKYAELDIDSPANLVIGRRRSAIGAAIAACKESAP